MKLIKQNWVNILKWIKILSAEMEGKEEEELLDKFGTTGYFIESRLLKLLALRLNPLKEDWMNFEFDLLKFKQVFSPYGQRGCLFKTLDYLASQGSLHYRIINNGKRIEIYSRKFEKSASGYVNRFRKLAEEEENAP